MIEIKNQRIADLEVGEKFSYHGTPSVKMEDGFVSEDDIKFVDGEASPYSTCFTNINLLEMFVYKNTLYIKIGNSEAKMVETPNVSKNFVPGHRVYKVHKLVVIL